MHTRKDGRVGSEKETSFFLLPKSFGDDVACNLCRNCVEISI